MNLKQALKITLLIVILAEEIKSVIEYKRAIGKPFNLYNN